MKFRTWGTRGSVSVSSPEKIRFGGNTTCLEVVSECLPKGHGFALDCGTGYVPFTDALLARGIMKVDVLMTHLHHDHTMGMPLAGHPFFDGAHTTVWGPYEHGIGPKEMLEYLFHQPFFPVEFASVKHRFTTHNLAVIGTQVLLIHPVGGFQLHAMDVFRRADASGQQLPFKGGKKFPISECLVVFMYRTVHPEYTVSYRFEERPTGRVGVFLTDHERTAAFPADLVRHVNGAHLFIEDGQYSKTVYETRTAGFGHATPEYCVELAWRCKVGKLGLTHHDPRAKDNTVAERLAEAKAHAEQIGCDPKFVEAIFACADYEELDV